MKGRACVGTHPSMDGEGERLRTGLVNEIVMVYLKMQFILSPLL